MYHIFYSLVNGHMDGLYLLAIISSAVIPRRVQMSEISFPLDIYPGVELMLFLVTRGASILFATMPGLIYTPTTAYKGFLLSTNSPTLIIFCYFDNYQPIGVKL